MTAAAKTLATLSTATFLIWLIAYGAVVSAVHAAFGFTSWHAPAAVACVAVFVLWPASTALVLRQLLR